jgi:hypothetical protein
MQLGFISRSLHFSGTCCTHHQEYNTAVDSHWYNIYALDREMYGNVHGIGGGQIIVVEFQLNHNDVTTTNSGQTLKWTLPYTSQSNAHVILVTVNCSIVLLMMGRAGT